MGGYRGDGYGMHGQYDDDDYYDEIRAEREDMRDDRRDRRDEMRGDRDRDDWRRGSERGAAQGNLMGNAESRTRNWMADDGDDRGRDRDWRAADDQRAVGAADEWRRRYGREGYEGSYGQQNSGRQGPGEDRQGHGRQNDPYHSFRQRHIDELDRDYNDWRSEREQQFGQDFDSWRQQRRQPAAMSTTSSPGVTGDQSSGPATRMTDADRAEAPAMPASSAQGSSEAGNASSATSSRRRASTTKPAE